jgi:hypothetical protein
MPIGCSLLNSRSVEKQPACIMDTHLTVASTDDTRAADERWAAWVARGAAHDAKSQKQSIVVAAVVAVGLGLWFARALFT